MPDPAPALSRDDLLRDAETAERRAEAYRASARVQMGSSYSAALTREVLCELDSYRRVHAVAAEALEQYALDCRTKAEAMK